MSGRKLAPTCGFELFAGRVLYLFVTIIVLINPLASVLCIS